MILEHGSANRRADRRDRPNRHGIPKRPSIGSRLVLLVFCPLIFQSEDAGIPWVSADIFTYNGDNRRPPRSVAEYRAIRATGIVVCEEGGQLEVGSGFVIQTGDGHSRVLTAGHVIRSSKDNTMLLARCWYGPYGQVSRWVKATNAPRTAGLPKLSSQYIRKDWGMLLLEGELPQTMPFTQRGKEEIFRLLESGGARLKLFSRHPNPPQSWVPMIQVSDECELLRPRASGNLLGRNPHILYHTCDATVGGSGGLLALELADGTTEAIGLHRSTANRDGYAPAPDGTNEAIPRSDRVSAIALSLASDGSMPKELRQNLPWL